MERFGIGTRIVAGAGAVCALAEFGAKRIFLVTDPYFHQNGTARRVAESCRGEAVEFFTEVRPDPSVELAAAGTARLKEFGADLVVALGGGSAMDCAKAMVYFEGSGLPLAAVPTTSGSGSEVTDFAVLTHGETKYPLVDPKLQPDAAILDSDLLGNLPKSLVADAGFDVLGHALEAFGATNANAITDALAKEAFCTALHLLPESFAGNKAVRGQLHEASTMAGMAFSQAGLGLCHALAHGLGAAYHVPHGRLIAILLPGVVDCNLPVCGEKYARLARAANLSGASDTLAVRNLKNALIRLRKTLNMPATLREAGIKTLDVESVVKTVLADPCCGTNPVKADPHTVRKVLEAVR